MKERVKALAMGAILCGALFGSAQASATTYTVQKGDTLYDLSKKTGTTVSAWKIANHLTSDKIQSGKEMNQPMSYRVVEGDTLWKLSQRYNTTVEEIQRANGLQGSLILVGQVLQLPVGSKEVTAAASATPEEPTEGNKTAPVHTDQASPVADAQVVKTLDCVATAYGPADSTGWGGLTKTGKHVAQGMIAVDPNVIPLGSKVWISGYNDPNLPAGGFMATAEDTGGAIRGNRIDIYIHADDATVRKFGVQNVTVKVLK
ncbi:peptidase M23 [Collibacillus ludicampi]|uniref:Peptidase M23 n=1 Tax=Collibacillus ludicampi TaxID=2771369 RepID=A0AAV4LAU7_9BACL|nr:LysM peptidoglycan-binding domain-containing protein [Collibacillus ludicampi]GIM44823.1 peptidase M23 [Collibacillus ludicampi]